MYQICLNAMGLYLKLYAVRSHLILQIAMAAKCYVALWPTLNWPMLVLTFQYFFWLQWFCRFEPNVASWRWGTVPDCWNTSLCTFEGETEQRELWGVQQAKVAALTKCLQIIEYLLWNGPATTHCVKSCTDSSIRVWTSGKHVKDIIWGFYWRT